jgi:hypothetical protein
MNNLENTELGRANFDSLKKPYTIPAQEYERAVNGSRATHIIGIGAIIAFVGLGFITYSHWHNVTRNPKTGEFYETVTAANIDPELVKACAPFKAMRDGMREASQARGEDPKGSEAIFNLVMGMYTQENPGAKPIIDACLKG